MMKLTLDTRNEEGLGVCVGWGVGGGGWEGEAIMRTIIHI